jgi:hypothetical protein
MTNYNGSPFTQYSLDKMNIDYFIAHLGNMKQQGFEADPRIIERIVKWIDEHDETAFRARMRKDGLI